VRAFADTNIVVYAEADDERKAALARAIIENSPVISTQVINETIAALTTKYGFSRAEAYEVAGALLDLCEVAAVDHTTVREAMALAARYRLSHGDALIAAAALQAGCEVLYTSDLQRGQVIAERLTVVNPFVAA